MITIKTQEEIEIMAEGGEILAGIMKDLEKKVRPGITTRELDRLAESLVFESGGKCSFKGYEGFPACLCTSINEEIVHALPSSRVLKEGDITSLDLGIFFTSLTFPKNRTIERSMVLKLFPNLGEGFHLDMAITLPVGKISKEAEALIKVTKEALKIGIEKVRPGNRFGDISRAIQKYVEGCGFNVVRELCGHGIGRNIHEEPQILNSVSFDKITADKVKFQGEANIELKEGMVFCIEPMVTVGDWHIKKSKDGFGWETKDGSLSCHFEHTVVVTKDSCKILTELE